MTEPYQPVSCARHERLENAVLKRATIDVAYRDESGLRVEARVVPLDVFTRDSAEWLLVRFGAGERLIRLDRIESFEELA